jgi:hypothetical protein
MNLRQHSLTPDAEAVLSELVEPLAGYIGATTCPPNTLVAALVILFESLRQIDADAAVHLATLCKNRSE